MQAEELYESVILVATSIRDDIVFTDFSREMLKDCCERTLAAVVSADDINVEQLQISALTAFNELLPTIHQHIAGMLQLCDAMAISYRSKTFTFAGNQTL